MHKGNVDVTTKIKLKSNHEVVVTDGDDATRTTLLA